MKEFLFFFLFISSLSGQVCFTNDWVLSFKVSSSTLDLALKLTADTLAKFDYVAIGFKVPSDPEGMAGADISVIELSTLRPTDRYAKGFGVPHLDTDVGGTNDNLNPIFDTNALTFLWQRPLVSSDVSLGFDKQFVPGNEYFFLWAAGNIKDGILQYHKGNRGIVFGYLDNDIYECDFGTSLIQTNEI